jgi:hypothetical protein
MPFFRQQVQILNFLSTPGSIRDHDSMFDETTALALSPRVKTRITERDSAVNEAVHLMHNKKPYQAWLPVSLFKKWDEIYRERLGPVFDLWGQPSHSENGRVFDEAFDEYKLAIIAATKDALAAMDKGKDVASGVGDQISNGLVNKLEWVLFAKLFMDMDGIGVLSPLLGVAFLVDVVKKFCMHEVAISEVNDLLHNP